MTLPAVRVDHLGKKFTIGDSRQAYGSLRESIADVGRRSLAAVRPGRRRPSTPSEVWALEDVSFDVHEGEVMGVVGRTGAGKSTLLKILSRITEPSRGSAEIRGRVGSLLEVGTGFHPELTGRENVFLNGAIMGMPRRDVVARFDDIIDFAEIGPFVDTPVKRYSSGMYLRLAFAVAAHLEPDVLLVDEVLAVGDYAFQERCMGKMREVGGEGRTVMFVSHNMGAVGALCSRAVLLDRGRVAIDGAPGTVIDAYFGTGTAHEGSRDIPVDEPRAHATGVATFREVSLLDAAGVPTNQLYLGQPFTVRIVIDVEQSLREAVLQVGIQSFDGVLVVNAHSIDGPRPPMVLQPGRQIVEVDLAVDLLPRQYSVLLGVHGYDGTTHDLVERALDFTVLNVGATPGDMYRWPVVRGYVRPASAAWRAVAPTSVDDG